MVQPHMQMVATWKATAFNQHYNLIWNFDGIFENKFENMGILAWASDS